MNNSIGEQLRNARLKKGLTFDQVFKEIHIRPRYLEALEDEQFSELPSEVQGRGFLRIYADFLKVKIQPLSDTQSIITKTSRDNAKSLQDSSINCSADAMTKKPKKAEMNQGGEIQIGSIIPPESEIRTSERIFKNVGSKLIQQRELLGLSLQEIEHYTHVKTHYLKAIENGQMDLLPSTVQGRGMVSNYANFLELDTDDLLSMFAEGLQIQREERISSVKINQTDSKTSFSRLPPWRRLISADLVIVSLLVLSLIGFSIWSLIQVSRGQENQAEASAPSISEMLLITQIATNIPTITIEALQTQTQQNISVVPEISDEIIIDTPVSGVPNLDTLPLQVYIVANQRAWMRVIVDGKVSFEGRVFPGNAYPFSGSNKIELLTGNGSALQVYFNQTDLGLLGNIGQVSGRIYSIEGVVTPTPQFTSTPTSTTAPTLTLMPSPTVPTATVTPYIP